MTADFLELADWPELDGFRRMTPEDLRVGGMDLSGPPMEVYGALVKWLRVFAWAVVVKPRPESWPADYRPGVDELAEVRCPRCRANLNWSFTWGLVHGEGYCSGSVGSGDETCGWPCRLYHFVDLPSGEDRIVTLLPYHPLEVYRPAGLLEREEED